MAIRRGSLWAQVVATSATRSEVFISVSRSNRLLWRTCCLFSDEVRLMTPDDKAAQLAAVRRTETAKLPQVIMRKPARPNLRLFWLRHDRINLSRS